MERRAPFRGDTATKQAATDKLFDLVGDEKLVELVVSKGASFKPPTSFDAQAKLLGMTRDDVSKLGLPANSIASALGRIKAGLIAQGKYVHE